jgi:hypothetical protein
MAKIGISIEMKKIVAEFKKLGKNKELLEGLNHKVAELYKPALVTFHRDVKDVIGDENYFKFVDKLPEFYKSGAVVREVVEKQKSVDF